MAAKAPTTQGVRVAVEGCGHGTLNAIYDTVAKSCKERGWDGVDVLIIGGDFQAARNATDLTVMSVPEKYRQLGDFADYYSGARKAPFLTLFIGGNHEASAYLRELYYGGWVAPNIYYLGAANVVRFGPLRIAALSGICKGNDYHKTHHERLPFGPRDVKSAYHVREFDVRKLLQLRTQVDVGLSHDWPRYIEYQGDWKKLFKDKPHLAADSKRGELGSAGAEYIMDRLRPPYWFSAHLHIKFAAIKKYGDLAPAPAPVPAGGNEDVVAAPAPETEANPDEIDLDTDDDAGGGAAIQGSPVEDKGKAPERPNQEGESEDKDVESNHVSDELRAQLPASFARPAPKVVRGTPGQPVPPAITNKEVRFLSLDKCLPRRHFLQLCEIQPFNPDELAAHPPRPKGQRYRLQYDPEWLSITRVFHKFLKIGDPNAQPPEDLGEEHYLPLIEAERAWVEDKVVSKGKLDVPESFSVTAPPHVRGAREIVREQPDEYTNPQTTAFCDLVGLEDLWDASAEDRKQRQEQMAPLLQQWGAGRGGAGSGGRGWRGGRGRGGGNGRGSRGRR